MSRGQIQALYFGSTVRCNARLRLLFDHGFVSRYYLPAAPFGAQAIYRIGKAAVSLVATRLEMEVDEVSRLFRRSTTAQFVEHTLAIVDLYLAFREAVANEAETEMERWLPELLCRHEYEMRLVATGQYRKEVFKPDAFVRLARRGATGYSSYFMEVDLGHTSSGQFVGKLASHQRYLDSGLFAETFGCDRFYTLVVTTGQRRLENLCSLVESCGSDLFWFTTFDVVRASGPLGPIWQVPLRRELAALI